jgi:hypothetical protein
MESRRVRPDTNPDQVRRWPAALTEPPGGESVEAGMHTR